MTLDLEDLLERAAPRAPAPAVREIVLRGQRRRRRRHASMAAMTVLVALVVVTLPASVMTDRDVQLQPGSTDHGGAADTLPEGCEIVGAGEGSAGPVLSADLVTTLERGLHAGFVLGPVVVLPVEHADLVGAWYLVAAMVGTDGEGASPAVWLSPHRAVAFAPDTGVPHEDWIAEPEAHPRAAHLAAVNDWAEQVAVWRRESRPAPPELAEAAACAATAAIAG